MAAFTLLHYYMYTVLFYYYCMLITKQQVQYLNTCTKYNCHYFLLYFKIRSKILSPGMNYRASSSVVIVCFPQYSSRDNSKQFGFEMTHLEE